MAANKDPSQTEENLLRGELRPVPVSPLYSVDLVCFIIAFPMPLSIRFLLRLEGLCVLAASTGLYASTGYSWLLFGAVLLVPDLFMVGYLVGPRVGALVYNVGHSYVVPIGLGVGAYLSALPLVGALALIWTAHIGMDRALGYGLKSPSGFRHTHLHGPSENASAQKGARSISGRGSGSVLVR